MSQMEPWNDQRTPALAIVARGNQISQESPNRYIVQSQSHRGIAYTVAVENGRWSCSCAFHAEAKKACIHILAVRLQHDLKAAKVEEPTDKPACPSCRSAAVVSNGKRYGAEGATQRFLCRTCGSRFTQSLGFGGHHADAKTIALALDLYFRGLSVRKVAAHLAEANGAKVGHVTIYRWVVAFGRIAAAWMDAQSAKTGARWHVDETVVKVDGEARYIWNVLDADSRFLLATHVSKNRSLANTRAPIKKAKAVASQRPTEVFTDGMMAYHEAIGKELGHICGPTGWVNPHRRVPSIRAPESNNRVERLHGTEKERIKVMRGFDTDTGCASLAEGFRAHYNLVRDHATLGTTPGVAAGLPAMTGFRWLDLLQKATAEQVSPEMKHAESKGVNHP